MRLEPPHLNLSRAPPPIPKDVFRRAFPRLILASLLPGKRPSKHWTKKVVLKQFMPAHRLAPVDTAPRCEHDRGERIGFGGE